MKLRFPSRRRILKIGGVLFSVTLLLAALLWCFPQQVLTVDSGPVQADVLVVLGGGLTERPKYAAELFQAGAAPLVICSGEGDCDSNRRILERRGVPRAAIRLEPKSRNTSENAQFTIKLLRGMGVTNVIIVTTWYHSRRALNTFEHYAPDLHFSSRPSYFAVARSDWKPQGIQGYVRKEYLKNLGYLVRYGVNPL